MLNATSKRSRKQAATASTYAHGGVYGHSAADSHVKICAIRRITTILLAMIITIGGMVFAAPQSVYADTILATNGWQQKEGYSIAPDDGTGIEWGYVGNNKWEYNTESKVFTVTPVDPTTIPTDHYKGTSDVGGEPGTLPKGNNSGYFHDTSSPVRFFRLPWLNQAYLKDVKTIIFNQDENGNKVSVPSGSANGMFKDMEKLETADVANLDVSEVTNMMNMFQKCYELSSIPGINTWNISKCTNINQMFYDTSSLKELDLSNWKVGDGAILAVASLFRNSGIKVLDISGLDPSKLSAVIPMFYSTDKGLDVLKLGSGWDRLTDEELKKYLGDEYSKTDWINDDVTKAGIKGAGVYVRSLESPLYLYAKKVDANGNGLEGAEFYVRNASGQYLKELPQYREEDGGTLKLDKPAKFTNDRSDALVFTSDSDGKLLIDGNDEEIKIDRAGTYILEEKTAPAGYRKDTDQYIVKISRGEEPEYIKGTATPGTTTEELDKNGEPVIHINDEVLIGDSSKYDRNQINYYENKEDGYELKKQAEWEDIEDGRAKISFTVKRPQLDEGGKNDYSPHAVYVFTPCTAHGFSANIARRNIEQLLRYYDTVDVIVLNGDSVDGIKYYDDVGSANGPTVSDVIEDTLFTTNQHRGINIPYALNKYFETHKWLNDTSGNKTGTETTVVYVSTDRKLLTSCNGLSYGSEGDPYATKEDMEKDVGDAFGILKKYDDAGAYFGIFGDYNDGENKGRYTFKDEGKQLLAWSIIDGLIDPKQYESMAGKSIEDAMAYAQNTTVMSYQNDFQSLGIAADPNNTGQEMVRTSKLTDTISTDLEVDSIEVYYYDDAGSKVTLTIPYTVDGQEFEFDLSDLDPAIEYHIDVHASVKELGNADDWFDTNDGNATLKDIRIVTGEDEDKEKSIEVESPRLHQVGVTYEGEEVKTKEGEDGAYLPIENEPVEPHEFTIKKVDARGNALKGATFTLSGKTDSGEDIKDVTNKDDHGNYLIGQTGEFDGRPTISATTDNDGKVTFSNLPDGTYTLTESIAPVGYASVPDMTVKVTTEKTTTGEGGQTTTEYTPKVSISLARYDKDAGVWVVTDPDTNDTSITEEQKNAKLIVTKTWKGAAPDSDSAAKPVIVICGFNESNVQWDFQSTKDAPEKWDNSDDTWTYTFDVSDQLSYTYFEEDYTGYATSAPEDPSNTKKAERDADGNFTAAVTNTELVKVNYTYDEYGKIKDDELTSEEREYNSNPTGSESEPDDGYVFSHWTADKDVVIDNGDGSTTTVKKGDPLTPDQVKKVVVTEEVTFTAHHVPAISGEGKETWGLKGKEQKGTPAFTPTGKKTDEGNKIEKYELLDKDGKVVDGDECPAYDKDGESIGTYKIDKSTGEVTFTPDADFVGDPKPAKVQATDSVGLTATAEYQPHVLWDEEEGTATRTIYYKYYSEDGQEAKTPVTQTSEQKLTRHATDFEKNDDGSPVYENGKIKYTYSDWTSVTLGDVTSPEIEGWNANRRQVDSVTATEPGRLDDKYVIYTPGKMTSKPYETWGLKGKSQEGKVTFELETPTLPDGSKNTVTSVTFLDNDGNPVGKTETVDGVEVFTPATSVDAYDKDGNKIGTYTFKTDDDGNIVIGEDGSPAITFTPDADFVGDPKPAGVRGYDGLGNSSDTTYTPHVVDDTDSATATRTIHYRYLTENGTEASRDVEQTVTMTREILEIDEHGVGTKFGPWKEATLGSGTGDGAQASPEIDGWETKDKSVPGITVKEPGVKDDVTVIYLPKPPVGTPDETWGGVDEEQSGKVPFDVTTKTLPDGSDNEITTVRLLDGDKEVTSLKVPEGTYFVNADNTLTFRPNPGFTGDPTPAKVVGTDKLGQKATTTYTPHVAATKETKTVSRTITYVYDDGTPVLDDDGNPLKVVQEATFTRTGTIKRDADGNVILGSDGTPEIEWGSWVQQSLTEVVSPSLKNWKPDRSTVETVWTDPDNPPEDEQVVYSRAWTVTYLDGDHGTSDGKGDEKDKPTGSNVGGGNGVTPKDGYKFTGWYTYVITDEDGNVIKTGRTDDPTSVEVIGNVVFTPEYEPVSSGDEPKKDEPKKDTTPSGGSSASGGGGGSTSTGGTAKGTAPKTGDETNLALWATLMLISLAGITAAFAMRRRQRAYTGKHANGKEE